MSALPPGHVVVWDGALDRQRQLEARAGVPPGDRCTFSLIGDTGLQGNALDDLEVLSPEYQAAQEAACES